MILAVHRAHVVVSARFFGKAMEVLAVREEMSLACRQPVCFESGEHDHLTVRRRRIPDAVGRSVLARGINTELDRLGDKLEGVADQRAAWNKRRELAFINGGVHRADYTDCQCR